MKELRQEKTKPAVLTCTTCANVYPNTGPFALQLGTVPLDDNTNLTAYTTELACPVCGAMRTFAALPVNNMNLYSYRGRQATERRERVASSMRWDPDLHEWLAAEAKRRGGMTTMADIANEAVRAYMGSLDDAAS
jgi:hypothetical protein